MRDRYFTSSIDSDVFVAVSDATTEMLYDALARPPMPMNSDTASDCTVEQFLDRIRIELTIRHLGLR